MAKQKSTALQSVLVAFLFASLLGCSSPIPEQDFLSLEATYSSRHGELGLDGISVGKLLRGIDPNAEVHWEELPGKSWKYIAETGVTKMELVFAEKDNPKRAVLTTVVIDGEQMPLATMTTLVPNMAFAAEEAGN
ncbi:hypothetical protein [Alcanivorax sp. 1008]|uniref:hypothetical protein n=1 Tax=Alcanivorax sp. 1008 TaxID=2816853 RepID=UPI001DA1EE12|nr:hypothetical protein [Alcanivorax sp. 1008]MCC1498214.1 hypothetical protein [Alcanivorax sp. 1008]